MKENRSIDCTVYERPIVEVLEVAVEAGFQDSPANYNNITGYSDTGGLENGGTWY